MLVARHERMKAIGQFQLAADLGQQSRSHTVGQGPSIAFTALSQLGDTYLAMGRSNDAADSYERALRIHPESEATLLSSAAAWASAGDLGRALRQVHRAQRLPQPSADVFLAHAQYLFQQQHSLPRSERDWQSFKKALRLARNQIADSWKLRLLEVDYAIHRDRRGSPDLSAALGKLLTLENDFGGDLDVLQRLPFIYQSLGFQADADRALNELEKRTSSAVHTKFLTVDLLLLRGDGPSARRIVESIPLATLSVRDQRSLRLAHLRILDFEADEQAIDQALLQYRSDDPESLFPIERLLDRRIRGVSTTNQPTNRELIKDLQQQQRPSQATWQYFQARLELQKETPDVSVAEKLLASLEKRLPHWTRTEELAGLVAMAKGHQSSARQAFERALSKPHPNPELVRMMLQGNVQRSDFLANLRMIERHHQIPCVSSAWVNGRWNTLAVALDYAELDRANRDGSAASETMWDAMVRGRNEIANHHMDVPSVMLSLWQAGEDLSKTTPLLTQLNEFSFATPQEREFVFGQAYQLAGQLAQAKQAYRKVVDDESRRLTAEGYAGDVSSRLILRDQAQRNSAEDEWRSKTRMEAIVKMRRASRDDLQQARQRLLSLLDSTDESENVQDRILLSKCLEQLGNLQEAVTQLEHVVDYDASAHHLSILIDFLLRNRQVDQADGWISRLEEQTGWEGKTVLLRARWMVSTKSTCRSPTFRRTLCHGKIQNTSVVSCRGNAAHKRNIPKTRVLRRRQTLAR